MLTKDGERVSQKMTIADEGGQVNDDEFGKRKLGNTIQPSLPLSIKNIAGWDKPYMVFWDGKLQCKNLEKM